MTFPDKLPDLRYLDTLLRSSSHLAALKVLDNSDFARWTASGKPEQHHYGEGGLQYHTWDVVTICLSLRDQFIKRHPSWKVDLDYDTLFLAALYHDIGKLRDYAPKPDTHGHWHSTPTKRTIHHISWSGIEWVTAAREADIDPVMTDEVLHAILSHHGARQFGSPVFPKTRVAWLLHLADQMSARMDDCDRLDLVDRS